MSSAVRRPAAADSPGGEAPRPPGLSATRRAEVRRKYPGTFATDSPQAGETAESIARECEQLRREIAADREAVAIEREITRLHVETAAYRTEAARDAELARLHREVNAEREALDRERELLARETGAAPVLSRPRLSAEQVRLNGRNGISAARSEALRRRYPGAYAEGKRP